MGLGKRLQRTKSRMGPAAPPAGFPLFNPNNRSTGSISERTGAYDITKFRSRRGGNGALLACKRPFSLTDSEDAKDGLPSQNSDPALAIAPESTARSCILDDCRGVY